MKKGLLAAGVVILSLIGLGFFQYQQLESGSAPGEGSLSALSTAFSATLSDTDSDLEQVNRLLGVLDHVSNLAKLDIGLFAMPSYVLLRDFSVTLYPAQSVGRTNPFLGIDETAPVDIAIPKAPTRESANLEGTSDLSAVDTATENPAQQSVNTEDLSAQQTQAPVIDTTTQSETPPAQSGNVSNPPQCDPVADPTCFDFSAANSLFGGGQ